ncbi:MAG: ribonuclease HII [Bacteroides sp. SM23_62_1]|nr:MAG: ribonuclease HII [Bacteroides sp. SM23_62_1]
MLKKHYRGGILEAGCDESGRGCLAGPVFAAAVIFPPDFYHPLIKDSKQLSARERDDLRKIIEENAISFAVGMACNEEIDDLNILNASILAMHRALDKLIPTPEQIIVDGNYFAPYFEIPHRTIIKGDSIYQSIAAASIIAKTYRDDYMINLNKSFPEYGWAQNKGYPTKKHREALVSFGISPLHRKSFTLLPLQYQLNLI